MISSIDNSKNEQIATKTSDIGFIGTKSYDKNPANGIKNEEDNSKAYNLDLSGEGWNILGSKTTGKAEKEKEENKENSDDNKPIKEEKKDEDGRKSLQENELTEEEQRKVEELKKIDKEVRTHEQAHLSAAGGYARGGANYSFVTGPDGKRYANGGHVNLDTSPEKEPEATIRKAETIRKAALAPAEPSSSDRQIAADATKMLQEAQRELAQNNLKKGL